MAPKALGDRFLLWPQPRCKANHPQKPILGVTSEPTVVGYVGDDLSPSLPRTSPPADMLLESAPDGIQTVVDILFGCGSPQSCRAIGSCITSRAGGTSGCTVV